MTGQTYYFTMEPYPQASSWETTNRVTHTEVCDYQGLHVVGHRTPHYKTLDELAEGGRAWSVLPRISNSSLPRPLNFLIRDFNLKGGITNG
jgi:hypothetical protein